MFQCDGSFILPIGQSALFFHPALKHIEVDTLTDLNYPYDVAVNNNQLLVASNCGNCITILTLIGNYISKFGEEGTGRGDLSDPTSLTIDMYGNIIVSEGGNHRVSVFNKDGVFIHYFGSKGSAEGQFSDPCGIALSPNGSIYISDSNNKRIQIFSDY